MGLPKLNTVEYFETLPVSKVEVKYRPFNVKEQKILLMALEEGNAKGISHAMLSLIKSCVELQDKSWKIEKLTNTDLEWMFIKIRTKSVGESTKLLLGCREENCDGQTVVDLDFNNDLKVVGEIESDDIRLTDNIGVKVRVPNYNDIGEFTEEEEELTFNNIFKLLGKCIVSIYDDQSVYDANEYTEKEMQEFIDELSVDQFNLIMNWFQQVPKLIFDAEFTCEKCGTQQVQTLQGLQNFFA